MWPPSRMTAREAAAAWQTGAGRRCVSCTSRRLCFIEAYCITFQFPNLLAVQREQFRQQIFWVTDFSNRPGARGPWGHAPEIHCADRSREMPANHHESCLRGRSSSLLSRLGWETVEAACWSTAVDEKLCSPRTVSYQAHGHDSHQWVCGASGVCCVFIYFENC